METALFHESKQEIPVNGANLVTTIFEAESQVQRNSMPDCGILHSPPEEKASGRLRILFLLLPCRLTMPICYREL